MTTVKLLTMVGMKRPFDHYLFAMNNIRGFSKGNIIQPRKFSLKWPIENTGERINSLLKWALMSALKYPLVYSFKTFAKM